MHAVVTEQGDALLARIEDDHMVFEATIERVEVTDVTLRFYRGDEQIGSIYNDDGTERTMARLTVPGETDFIGVEVPKSFVRELLDAAVETDRVQNPEMVEGYRLRVLRDA